MAKHAFLSASGADAWLRCKVKPWREKDLPEVTSKYAQEGIEAHSLLEQAIKTKGFLQSENIKDHPAVKHIETTLALLEEIAPTDSDKVLPEQRLSISHITGEKGANGTADVVVIGKDEVVIIDLKYGKGVRVHAEDNTQLFIYGAAALKSYGKDKKTLRMVISQPRLDHVSEWVLTAKEVAEKIKFLKKEGEEILAAEGGENLLAVPGTKQCQFCKAKAECSERASWLEDNPVVRRATRQVEELIFPNLDDTEYIEAAMGLTLEKEATK